MGRKTIPGLIKRNGVWHIDKKICGRRVCQSTGTRCPQEAERYLARLMEEMRQALVYGVRPVRTFEEAAAKFVIENQHKRSIGDDISRLKGLLPFIGDIPLDKLHMGALQPWLVARRRKGVSSGTINHGLQIVRRILNLAAGEWMDDQGLTWIHAPPKIKLLATVDKRKPFPLSWDEQDRLFAKLPAHLADMAMFAVNTGCRQGEICRLRWEWEVQVPALETSIFIVPGTDVKNGEERLIVMNAIARRVVAAQRGKHDTHVFSYKAKPIRAMLNTGWKKARDQVGMPHIRVHDLKHTFGRRLRAAGVSFEDRQDLLGHRSGRITSHYSAAELFRLIEAAETVTDRNGKRPEFVVLRGDRRAESRKTPATSTVRSPPKLLSL